jgi:hypothetical protein
MQIMYCDVLCARDGFSRGEGETRAGRRHAVIVREEEET